MDYFERRRLASTNKANSKVNIAEKLEEIKKVDIPNQATKIITVNSPQDCDHCGVHSRWTIVLEVPESFPWNSGKEVAMDEIVQKSENGEITIISVD